MLGVLFIVLSIISVAAVSSLIDNDSASRTWNEFCNLECLSRRTKKQCC